MNENSQASAHRQFTPAFTLFSTARYALVKARRTQEGSALELLTAVLMLGLTFEAFLNQVGENVWGTSSDVWAAVERLRPMDKLKAIAEQVGFSVDLGVRPAQTVSQICRYRNGIVHGKPQEFRASVPRKVAIDNPFFAGVEGLSPEWEQACTPEYVERAISDLDALTDALSKRVGMANPLHVGDFAGASVPAEPVPAD